MHSPPSLSLVQLSLSTTFSHIKSTQLPVELTVQVSISPLHYEWVVNLAGKVAHVFSKQLFPTLSQ